MKNEVPLFLSHGQEKDFLSYWMVYWKMSRFVQNIIQNKQIVSEVFALSCSYINFWATLDYFHVYAQTELSAL